MVGTKVWMAIPKGFNSDGQSSFPIAIPKGFNSRLQQCLPARAHIKRTMCWRTANNNDRERVGVAFRVTEGTRVPTGII